MLNIPLFKLINGYYVKAFFGPFFTIVFPIIVLFIMGNAFYDTTIKSGAPIIAMRSIVGGVLITNILATGFMSVPFAIIEFKKSTLMKRVGAAQISVSSFMITVLIYYFLWAVFGAIWLLLWAGILIGTKDNMDWTVAFSPYIGEALVFMVLVLILSVSFGIMVVALSKTVQQVMGITNVMYMPVSLLSGSFIPKDNVDNSTVLNIITYILPTKYSVDPFFQVWEKGFGALEGWESYTYPIITIGFIGLFLVIAIRKFKWSA